MSGEYPLTRSRFAALFVLVTAFLNPSTAPPYPYYLVSAIGLSALLWGVVWWIGMKAYESWRGLRLSVTRIPCIRQEEENGEWVMIYEIIRHRWMIDNGANESGSEEDTIL
jgi:hypothetical protein